MGRGTGWHQKLWCTSLCLWAQATETRAGAGVAVTRGVTAFTASHPFVPCKSARAPPLAGAAALHQPIIPYHSLSLLLTHYHALSLPITPYHSLSFRIIRYHSLSLRIISYHSLSRLITPYHSLSRLITPYHALSRPITPHHAPPRPTTPHHALSRYAPPFVKAARVERSSTPMIMLVQLRRTSTPAQARVSVVCAWRHRRSAPRGLVPPCSTHHAPCRCCTMHHAGVALLSFLITPYHAL